jgi:hypothetical protein
MICPRCNHELGGSRCVPRFVIDYVDSTSWRALPYTGRGPCPDCRVPPGSVHHEYCDQERCPRCDGQLISCVVHDLHPPRCLQAGTDGVCYQ